MDATPRTDLDFTAIDFETANSSRASACAVGLAKVRSGEIVDTASWLIKPAPGADDFAPWNVKVHGITAERVAGERSWGELYAEVMGFVGNDDLVAHNAPFDRSVFQQTSSAFDLDWPENRWFDTLPFARRHLTLGSYSLPFVVAALGIEDLTHHEAQADATQAARIAAALAAKSGVSTLDELARVSGFDGATSQAIATAGGGTRSTGDFSSLRASDVLAGEHVVFTGTLTLTKRDEALALVEHFGGTGQKSVTAKTTVLVSGDLDPRTLRPGATLSRKLASAMERAEKGQRIEIWTEGDFHERLAVGREALEEATRAQRVAVRSSWLPSHVVEQARIRPDPGATYQSWLRDVLRHPDGPPETGDQCLRCGGDFGDNVYWLFFERRVCSGDCNDALKRAAKRAWKDAGIIRPDVPNYAELYWSH